MKIYVFALLIVATVAIAAFTNEDEDKKTSNFLSENEEELQLASAKEYRRVRRFTCDLLSGLGFDHSACAAHCILRGKTGGRCSSDGVCLCREKSIGK